MMCPSGAGTKMEKDQNEDDTPKEESTMNWKVILVLLVINACYIVLGGVIFHFIEEPNESSVRTSSINLSRDFLNNFTCVSQEQLTQFVKAVIAAYDQGVLATNTTSSLPNWDIYSSIFFSSTVVTTIGYGNISPSTRGGQAFCCVYALIGIPLNLVLLGAIGGRLARVGEKLKHLKSLQNKPRACMTVRLLVCVGVGFVLLVFIPSAIFVATEGWSYSTSLYYSVITLTTVGFGDYVAGVNFSGDLRGFYRLSICIWLIIGLSWVGWLIGDAQEFGNTVVSKIGKKKENKKEDDEINGDGNKNIQDDKKGQTNDVMMTSMPDG